MTQSTSADPSRPGTIGRHDLIFRIAVIVLIALAVYWAGREGMRFRRWVWDTTTPIRFTSDIDRGFDWGRTASTEGFLNQYEKMQVQRPGDRNWLDYGPLRLGVMTLWAKWAAVHHPAVRHWHEDGSYELTAPLLRFTLGTEIVGVIAAFLLVRLWAARRYSRAGWIQRVSVGIHHRRDPNSSKFSLEVFPFFRGVIPGLFAAAVLWFNPATALDGYGWPSYDVWVIPFFLLAVLAASGEWWFAAGIILGVGGMLKGQLLGAVPVLAIWAMIVGPFPKGRLGVAHRQGLVGSTHPAFGFLADLLSGPARVVGGAAVAIAVIASPWLLSSIPADKLAAARAVQAHAGQAYQAPAMAFAIARQANVGVIVWVTGVALCVGGLPWIRRWSTPKPHWPAWARSAIEHPWFWRTVAGVTTFLWAYWPWLRAGNRHHFWTGLACAGVAAVLVLLVRPGRALLKPVLIATATALLLGMSVFNASSAWWDCGVKFGTEHWPSLAVGTPDNVPALLTASFHWDNNKLDAPAMSLAAGEVLRVWPRKPTVVSIGQLLRLISEAGVLVAAIGLGIQARRRDARVLIAVVTPWIWFYCFTPQVQERYLVFAAAASCVCAGVSTGMTLLGMLLSVIATVSVLHVMLMSAGYTATGILERGLGAEFPNVFNKDGPKLRSLGDGSHPELAWAVGLIAMIHLYFTVAIRGWISKRAIRRRVKSVAKPVEFGTVPAEAIPVEVPPVVAVPAEAIST